MDLGALEPHFPPGQNNSFLQPQRDETDSLGVVPLGSGSDFTVFLQRIGASIMPFRRPIYPDESKSTQVASSNEDFITGPNDPVYHYHSIFDSQRWQEVYGDPGFHRHVSSTTESMIPCSDSDGSSFYHIRSPWRGISEFKSSPLRMQ